MDPVFTSLDVIDLPPDDDEIQLVAAVFVLGESPLPYSQHFFARFDDLEILAVNVDVAGTGFRGFLTELPAEGAHLIVQFEGEAPIDTGLVYHAPEPPVV